MKIIVYRFAVVALVSFFLSTPAMATGQPSPLEIETFSMTPTASTTEILNNEGKIERFQNIPYEHPFRQAGGHPWALTTTIGFKTEEVISHNSGIVIRPPTRDPKDVVTDLPPGLLGNPMAVPRCSLTVISAGESQCPADTQIGDYVIHWFGGKEEFAPIVNVTPEAGQSAEFAFENTVKVISTPLLTGRLVRTAEGYGFEVVSHDIPLAAIQGVEATFWGVPGDPSHNSLRGQICTRELEEPGYVCQVSGGQSFGYSPVTPFLTMPANCSAGPETATLRADSWEEPGTVEVGGRYSPEWKMATATLPAATGCNKLAFEPRIEAHPDTLLSDEPVGLNVTVGVPLSETPLSLATPQLRDTELTLPEGLSVSPGVVDGVQACEAEGPEGIDIEGSGSEEIGLNGELQLAPGHCPDASIVGTAEAITPFLPEPIKGHVYLARPGCGGGGQAACTEHDALDGNLYRLYLELGGTGELAKTGVHFKVPMETSANLATGQLSTRVLNTPQAPFSELTVHLNGGPRAPLANPAACGPAVTTADFTPWSAPGVTPAPESLFVPGVPDATPSSFFDVEGCSSPPPFAPSFTAGTAIAQAGQYSPFTTEIVRQDREQYVKGIQVQTPPGLTGVLANVPLCQEPAADLGTCSVASKIGTTRVDSGAGSHPFELEGDVYLTGPYRGAPFGLSIVVHVVAGPFNLGVRVVRARVQINPQTAALTVTADETGPYAIPQIVFGVPVRLRRVIVDVDRPHFMVNPTSCREQNIVATLSGSQQAQHQSSSRFATGGCRALSFKPKFTVSTNAHTNRRNGASLDAKLTFAKGAFGTQANVAFAKVDLPKQLPSRLTTLQKACPAATFAADPARCPPQSIVGTVRADTPLLPVQLRGPVYFVSHGGEQFPSLIVVLQGDGVRIDLTGTTFIGKSNVTSTTFKSAPDAPVSSFEIYLPQGPFSALGVNGNLCRERSKLKMPTLFRGQNGIQFKQTTKIAVLGCTKHKGKAARASRRRGER